MIVQALQTSMLMVPRLEVSMSPLGTQANSHRLHVRHSIIVIRTDIRAQLVNP